MRSALPFLLFAAFSLPAVPASSAQAVNPQTDAMCEPQPTDMDSVLTKAEAGDASAEYELGRSTLSGRRTDRKSDGKRVENKIAIGLVKDFSNKKLRVGRGRKTAPPHQSGGFPRMCNLCGSGTSLRGT